MATNNGFDQEYMKSFSSFAGADIVATFGNKVFGELQAITYAVQREIAPIYTFGSPEPRSFSRNKRGISGTLVFVVFDRDALLETLIQNLQSAQGAGMRKGRTAYGNIPVMTGEQSSLGMQNWETQTGNLLDANRGYGELTPFNIRYVDQIPAFDITISFANEYGQTSSMEIKGIQILNEGSGMSIDDMVVEKACSFVARSITPMGYNDYIKPNLG